MSKLRYFYYNPVKGHDVPGGSPVVLSRSELEDMIYDTIGDEPDSFFGAVNSRDVTLQFYLEDHHEKIRMEIPDPSKQGSYATYVTFEAALETLVALNDDFVLSDFPNLQFESWRWQ